MSYYVDNSGAINIIPDDPSPEEIASVLEYMNKKPVIDEVVEVPINFVRISENCGESANWERIGFISEGTFGDTYHVCRDTNDCKYTLKVQDIGGEKERVEYMNEVTMLSKLQGWRGVPVLYGAWTCEDKGYYVMELLFDLETCGIPEDKVWANATHLLDELHGMGYIHGDTHKGNIMCRGDGNLVFVDFGSTVYFPDPNAVLANEMIHVEADKKEYVKGKGWKKVYPYNMRELAATERWKLSHVSGAPEGEIARATALKKRMEKGEFVGMGGYPPRVLTGDVDKALGYVSRGVSYPTRDDLVLKEKNRLIQKERDEEERRQRFISRGMLYPEHPYGKMDKNKIRMLLKERGLSTEGTPYELGERLLQDDRNRV